MYSFAKTILMFIIVVWLGFLTINSRVGGYFQSQNTSARSYRTGSVETIATSSAAYTLDASDICDNTILTITSLSAVATFTMPGTSTLHLNCLTVNGRVQKLTLVNGSSATSSVVAIGAGGSLNFTVSTTINASDSAQLEITRVSANEDRILITNHSLP